MSSTDGRAATRRYPIAGEQRLAAPVPLNELSVFAIVLGQIEQSQRSMIEELDEAERDRAAAFKIDLHRQRFVARRWWRRRIIAQTAGVDPQTVGIEHDHLGKPRIVSPEPLRSWSVSSSHSNGVAVMALSRSRPVGIDVANCDACHATPESARVFMTDGEFEQWSKSDAGDKVAHFYRLWARKEASLKALGTGFATDPRTVDVRHSRVVHAGTAPLVVVDLAFRAGWACALASESRG